MRMKGIAHQTIQCCTQLHSHKPNFIHSQRLDRHWTVGKFNTFRTCVKLENFLRAYILVKLNLCSIFCFALFSFVLLRSLWTKYHIPHRPLSIDSVADMHAHCTCLFHFLPTIFMRNMWWYSTLATNPIQTKTAFTSTFTFTAECISKGKFLTFKE